MALLHRATLTPPKIELVAAWLPAQPFGPDSDASIERVAAYRFDDPAGEVGIETLLVRVGENLLQVPLTYRNDPLVGAEASLIGTMEHSVLGTRWVYDAVGDPVYLAELVRVAVTGDSEVELHREENGVRVPVAPDARVRGSGHPTDVVAAVAATPDVIEVEQGATATRVRAGGADVSVVRVVGRASIGVEGAAVLSGSWAGVDDALLAAVRTL